MKNAAEYARRVRRLLAMLKREATRPKTEPVGDPLEQLLVGLLGRSASETRAAAGLQALRDATVDLNELRVTPVSEMVELLGPDYPQGRLVAESVSRVLNAIFNRQHDVALANLRSMGVKAAMAFLSNLDGVDPHARALVIMRVFNGHAFPVDDNMLAFLRRSECVPPAATQDEVQSFLDRQIKPQDAELYYHALKRYAATHTGRAPKPARATAGESARPRGAARRSPSKNGQRKSKQHSAGRSIRHTASASNRRRAANKMGRAGKARSKADAGRRR